MTFRRFSKVDKVSDDIFCKVLPFPSNTDFHSKETDTLTSGEGFKSKLLDVTDFLSGAFARGAVTDTSTTANPRNIRARLIVVEDQDRHLDDPELVSRETSYEYHQRRKSYDGLTGYSTLPADVDMLDNAPQAYDDETTMAAIRKVMVDQKRVVSRQNLPKLAPADAAELEKASPNRNSQVPLYESEASLRSTVRRRINRRTLRIISLLSFGTAFLINPVFFQYLMVGCLIVSAEIFLLYSVVFVLRSFRTSRGVLRTGVSMTRFWRTVGTRWNKPNLRQTN